MPPLLRKAASTATASPPDAPLLPVASTAMRFDTTTRRRDGPGATTMGGLARRGVRTTVSREARVNKRVIGSDVPLKKLQNTAGVSTRNG